MVLRVKKAGPKEVPLGPLETEKGPVCMDLGPFCGFSGPLGHGLRIGFDLRRRAKNVAQCAEMSRGAPLAGELRGEGEFRRFWVFGFYCHTTPPIDHPVLRGLRSRNAARGEKWVFS